MYFLFFSVFSCVFILVFEFDTKPFFVAFALVLFVGILYIKVNLYMLTASTGEYNILMHFLEHIFFLFACFSAV